MSAVLGALAPVFMLIAAGAALRRTLLPGEAEWHGVEQITYFVLIPALLIETLMRADFMGVPFGRVGGALTLSVVAMAALCLALWPILSKRGGLGGPAFSSLFQGATRWQTFVALAVASNLHGDEGLALASVAMVAMIPLLNVINIAALAHFASPGPTRWGVVALTILRNPFIWSCAAGVLLNVTQAPVPKVVVTFLDTLGRSSLALGLMVVGAGLRLEGILRPRPAAWLATALKLALMPIFAVSLGLFFGLSGTGLVVVAICASVPTASSAFVLARQLGGDAPFMAQIITLQTIVAAATMPLVIALTTLA